MSRACPAMSRRRESERESVADRRDIIARHQLLVGRPAGPTTLNGGVEGMTEQVGCPDVPHVYREGHDIGISIPSTDPDPATCLHCGSRMIEKGRCLDCGRAAQ